MFKLPVALFSTLCFSLCWLAGCGGSTMVVPPTAQSSSVTFTMTDTPPQGVSVLSFEVSLTGASLNPGGIDLLGSRSPVRIEVKQLETESAFLNTANVPPGDYTTLNLTFANVEMTFQNNTAAALAECAVGAVCEIHPTGTLTTMISLPSSGLTVAANSNTGLLVDVNPNVILTSTLGVDFSQTGATTVQQLQGKQRGELDDLDDLKGTVQGLDAANQKFTLHTASGDFAITANSSTEFDFKGCTANNFTCLQNNEVVSVDLLVMSGGAFVAKKIEFEDQAEDDELEGIITKVDDATHFEIVVLNELRDVANAGVGNPVTVTLGSGAQFQVDADGLQVPSTLQTMFEAATDTSQLIAGQDVQVQVKGAVTAGTTVMASASRVRLRTTQFTAMVSGAPAPPNFNVTNLPALFTGIATIQVQTSSKTNFDGGLSDLSGLADGNTVSLRGLLFSNGANPPVLVAAKVRKR